MTAYQIYKQLLPERKRGIVQYNFTQTSGYSYPSFARLIKEQSFEPMYYKMFEKLVIDEANDLLKELKTVLKSKSYAKRVG